MNIASRIYKGWRPVGKAPRIGSAGILPNSNVNGEIKVSRPTANPAPVIYAKVEIKKLGRYKKVISSNKMPPRNPG